MKRKALIDFDPETNAYSAVCPDLLGCASTGDSNEAIRLYPR